MWDCIFDPSTTLFFTRSFTDWEEPDACGLPRLFTANLVPGVCTPVSFIVPGNAGRPYRAQVLEYWRLDSVSCAPPAPATILPLTLRALWTRNAGSLPVGSCGIYAPQNTAPDALPLPNSDNPASPRDFQDYFTDLPLFSAPRTSPTFGFCNPNVTFFTGERARPRSTQVSLNVYPNAANPNAYDMEVFNNLLIQVPNDNPATFVGCNTARDASNTPTSRHYMGTVTIPLEPGIIPVPTGPTTGGCSDFTLTAPSGISTAERLANMGVDAFQLSGRLFRQTAYATSTTAPDTPGSSAAAAAAKTANSALTEANTGLIIGAVGVALAIMAFVALAYSCHMVRSMKNQLDNLTPVKGVSEWGASKAPTTTSLSAASDTKTSGLLAGLPGTPTPQPNPLNNASLNTV
jgi:hypothetical protein